MLRYEYQRFLMIILGLASITSSVRKYKTQISKARYGIKVERFSIKLADKNYIIVHDFGVTKFNRSSPYRINGNATMVTPWGKNTSVLIKSYELRNNQYRESFITMNLDFCDFLEHNFIMVFARMYSNLPTNCPVIGNIYYKGLQVREADIPLGFPPGGWKFSFNFYYKKSIKSLIFIFEAYFRVEREN